MNISLDEALELFEITDISQVTKAELNSKFKQLAKKYHPDVVKDDNQTFIKISNAKDLLHNTIEKLNLYKMISPKQALLTIVLPLNKLIALYNGDIITIGKGENAIDIDRIKMKRNNSLILSTVAIEHNGLIENFDNIQPWNLNDNYSIDCVIKVEKIVSCEKIKICLLEKEKYIEMTSQSLAINFKLQYNINISINITKKIIAKADNTS